MLTVSLTDLIEEATLGSDAGKRATGQLMEPNRLFEESSLRSLDESHDGAFGFIAFDPSADVVVRDYLQSQSLANDSGSRILVLWVSPHSYTAATAPSGGNFPDWLSVESRELPARRLLEEVFAQGNVPPLPGLILFDSWVDRREVLFFPLGTARDVDTLRTDLRKVFSVADGTLRRHSRSDFVSKMAVNAQRERISFERSGRVSFRQWLVQSYQFFADHSGDIIAAIGLVPLGA